MKFPTTSSWHTDADGGRPHHHRNRKLIIYQHGDKAVAEAMRWSNRFAGIGATEGAAVWKRIASAIEEMQKTKPDGERN